MGEISTMAWSLGNWSHFETVLGEEAGRMGRSRPAGGKSPRLAKDARHGAPGVVRKFSEIKILTLDNDI